MPQIPLSKDRTEYVKAPFDLAIKNPIKHLTSSLLSLIVKVLQQMSALISLTIYPHSKLLHFMLPPTCV